MQFPICTIIKNMWRLEVRYQYCVVLQTRVGTHVVLIVSSLWSGKSSMVLTSQHFLKHIYIMKPPLFYEKIPFLGSNTLFPNTFLSLLVAMPTDSLIYYCLTTLTACLQILIGTSSVHQISIYFSHHFTNLFIHFICIFCSIKN